MSPKNLIDSNVLLRYLTWDDPEKAERCKELFKRLEFGIETAILSEMTLAEVIWTLQKFFKLEKSSIRDILKPILNFKGLKVQNREIIYQIHFEIRHTWCNWSRARLATYPMDRNRKPGSPPVLLVDLCYE